MALCNCDSGLLNTGLPNCVELAGVTKKLIMVQTTANDGTSNVIDLVGDLTGGKLTAAFITGKLNEADSSKRWFPLGEFKNVEDTKADPITESFNDGSNVFIQEGVRTFTGVLVGAPYEYLKQLNAGRCVDFSVFIIDADGSITGVYAGGDIFAPIAVDRNTFVATLMKTTDTTAQKITIAFEFSRLEKDEDLKLFSADDIDVNLLKVNGLIDVNMAASLPTTTSTTVALTFNYGSVNNKQTLQGAVVGDFTAYNNTDLAAVALLTATEVSDGVYLLTYAAQTVADVVEFTFSKTGFSGVKATATLA